MNNYRRPKKAAKDTKNNRDLLTLHHLKPEKALFLFMQVDPVKAEAGMKRVRMWGATKRALSKA